MPILMDQNEYTAEELLHLPDGDLYELVDGHLVKRSMGFESGLVGGKIFLQIGNHCDKHKLGYVNQGGDGSYQCFEDHPRLVRKPDVSFVRYGRFKNEQIPSGHAQLAPDLAVEVISPNDLYEEVEKKIGEYLRAGVRLVWIASPESKTILVHHPDGSCRRLLEGDELLGEDVLPGFRCLVGDLFPKPPEPQA